jgi:serpin B
MWMKWNGTAALLVVLCSLRVVGQATGQATGQAMGPAAVQAVDPATESLVGSDNGFALDLYGQLRSTEGNLFFSPYSIDSALMMVRAGAAGGTGEEITRTLKLAGLKPEEIGAASGVLANRFSANIGSKGYDLHVANAMWGEVGANFLPEYMELLKRNFAAELNEVEFRHPEEASGMINDWVTHKTNGRITSLISAGAINDLTKLILTNAIYFKGTWSEPFKTRATHEVPWDEGAGKSPAKATMMFQTGDFDFLKEEGLEALQMPYAGGDLAMLVILPERASGLGDLEKTLDAKRLAEIVAGLRPEEEVEVGFPKFKLETQYDLAQTLPKMGMPSAFSEAADFSGIDGKRGLYISGVIHKAFVQVDESGTEAAGATGVVVAAMSVRASPRFIADHPFVFAIRDVKTGTILFMGRVVKPGE